ncbi:hypothetical protein AB0B60_43540, partial [Streptomyces lincolnensis]|uniref:hypothetical protein n=1 Tax=Streptomyces lincolnensis TaxID=1915 RepID=UPI0033D97FF9
QAADRMARAMHELSRAVGDPEAAGGLLSLAGRYTTGARILQAFDVQRRRSELVYLDSNQD